MDVDEPFERWKSAVIPRLNEVAAGHKTTRPAVAPAAGNGETMPAGEGLSASAAKAAPAATFSRDNPLLAPLVDKRDLTHNESTKSTLHLAFSIEGTGLRYEVGDACGVIPQNDLNLVAEILQTLRFNGNEQVPCGKTGTTTLHDALTHHLQITRLNRKIVKEYATKRQVREASRSACSGAAGTTDSDTSMTAVSSICWSSIPASSKTRRNWWPCCPSSRRGSIPSHPVPWLTRVRFTQPWRWFAIDSHNRERGGVCSTLFADRSALSDRLPIYIQPNKKFKLPQDSDAPIIMIGPGTGIAPFRGFLHERRALGAKGRNWLFFGERSAATDYLYREELESNARGWPSDAA